MAVRKKTSRTPTTSARATKIDFMKATNNIGKPVAAIAGFAVGKYALKKLSKSQTVTGLMGTDMKDYILPAAVTMGGLIGTQFTKNEYIQLGLVGAAGAGVEAIIKKATGKTILQGLEGLIGDDETPDFEDMSGLRALNPVTQALPAADIDIEREIQRSVSGAADFSMSDEPIGNITTDYSMSDDPIGNMDYSDDVVGSLAKINPDSMDFDIFSGDMMES
ncbi:hypothetical protein [Carboxylicivirga caseinilyticus]|uniref:hypothetical protein n=1 Tax=Carboxylicivirga caseinilyticus TaxID=3417572 RepID=UPI000CCB8EAD|nr:hypothetical protein [Marinilabiliaceae bacterium A049]PKP08629.1 MAG: hypothetical protein CVU09_14890 [Bacteroidetes bacterium HGW-Bacteroidetes-4]